MSLLTRSRTLPALLVVLALALAATTATAQEEPAPEEPTVEDDSPFGLASQPVPQVTGADIMADLEEFVAEFPFRYTGAPTEVLAGQWIEDHAAELGYDTEIRPLPAVGPLPGTAPLAAVTAVKAGTDLADQVMLFVGHYDGIPGTIEAAYDNGSGTVMMLALAEALAEVETRRSIMFAWYNGEEEGLLSSQRHAAALKAEGVDVEVVLGFDMVGIAHPVAAPDANSCLCMFHGGDDAGLATIMAEVNFEFLGFPDVINQVRVAGVNSRNSDERSFENLGAATMRWAGRRTASSYRAYHMPDDSIATMDDVAGGRSYLEQGLENTLRSAYYTALAVDTFDSLGSTF